MTRQDLPAVTEIDREAFPTQWPPADYGYEFKNHMAHYFVACDTSINVETDSRPQRGIASWFRRLLHSPSVKTENSPTNNHYIVGFVGFWIMAGEAHVTSIAVREKYRKRGIGELLLIAAIDLSIELKAEFVTLEVRVSNLSAQALYLKYGFKRVGERHKYYLDHGPNGETREDAIIMTTDSIGSNEFQRRLRQLKAAHHLK
jgi:ribosomal-protein-alanine N-acetyltransferase